MGDRTHWDECWRDPAHHGCAVGQVEKWKSKYSRLAGDYAEEASYLRKRAERAEDIAKSVRTGAPLYDMLEQRNAAITRAEQAEAEVERLTACLFQMQEAAKERTAEVEWLRKDYHHACATVAQLYAAATGRHGEGPLRGVIEDAAAVCSERDALRAEVERLRADAERYRWLRDVATGDQWDYIMTTEDTDAAIDAARG